MIPQQGDQMQLLTVLFSFEQSIAIVSASSTMCLRIKTRWSETRVNRHYALELNRSATGAYGDRSIYV